MAEIRPTVERGSLSLGVKEVLANDVLGVTGIVLAATALVGVSASLMGGVSVAAVVGVSVSLVGGVSVAAVVGVSVSLVGGVSVAAVVGVSVS